jgi:glycosyltransferase involved in cell wall biosynthesis
VTAREPTVSVLMPVYNAEGYLAVAVESILAQTLSDFEFLIIDDGSTDTSLAILEQFARRDGRVRLVSRPNAGVAASLNDMIDLARGEFLARMDSDDIAATDRFELQVAYLRAHPDCVAVGSSVELIDPDGDTICARHLPQSHEEIDEILLVTTRGYGICHPAVMLRHDTVVAIGKYSDRLAEDRDLLLRLGERGKLANLPKLLLKSRQHYQNLSDVQNQRIIDSMLRSIQEAETRRRLANRPIPISGQWTRPTPAQSHSKWAWWALAAGNIKAARKHAAKRLIRAPFSVESWKLLYCVLRGH